MGRVRRDHPEAGAISMRITACLLLLAALLPALGCREEKKSTTPAQPQVIYREEPRAQVTGRVLAPGDLENWGIMVFAEGTSHAAYTDSLGYYTISGLGKGDYRFRAVRHDLASMLLGEVSVQEKDLAARQPFANLGEIQMSARSSDAASGAAIEPLRLASLRGRVLTTNPEDSDGVLVEVVGSEIRTVTDSVGLFSLQNMRPGRYTLRFSRRGYAPKTVSADIPTTGDAQMPDVALNIVDYGVTTGRSIFGQVAMLDAAGASLARYDAVQVRLEGSASLATLDRNGRFTFRGLDPGVYVVSAVADGFTLDERFEVDLTELDAVEVTLVLRQAGGDQFDLGSIVGQALLGDVTDSSGHTGITVSLAGSNYVSTTDGEGFFRLDSIEPGDYDLVASMPGYKVAGMQGIAVEAGQITAPPAIVLDPDVEAPRVVRAVPADGTSDLTIESPTIVMLTFNQVMDPATFSEAIRFSPEVEYAIQGEGQHPLARPDRLVMALAGVSKEGEVLRFGRRYSLTLAPTVRNMEGVAMEEPFRLSFTTGRAKIIRTFPTDGAEGVVSLPDRPLRVYFNAPVDGEDFEASDVRFEPQLSAQPNVYFRHDARTGWSTLAISAYLAWDEDYTVTIRGRLRTTGGDSISNMPYTFRFKTGSWTEGLPEDVTGQR